MLAFQKCFPSPYCLVATPAPLTVRVHHQRQPSSPGLALGSVSSRQPDLWFNGIVDMSPGWELNSLRRKGGSCRDEVQKAACGPLRENMKSYSIPTLILRPGNPSKEKTSGYQLLNLSFNCILSRCCQPPAIKTDSGGPFTVLLSQLVHVAMVTW